MNDFDDFDNDTPPQGGSQEELDAELVMGAERQAEEDQMLAELAREEEDDRQAEQRRLDTAHRDQAQRDDDDRRDGIQSDIDRRDDWNRAEQERVARQAELDAEMEFSMGPEKDKDLEEPDAGEKMMHGVRVAHAADMQGHYEKQAALEAESALREQQAQGSHYKGGFVDLKGNTVSAQDVNAIMANHRASGGHQAAQERFGLAPSKGSDLAAAHYAPGADLDAAPTAAEQLGALRGGHQMTNAELLQKVEADQVATDERQAEAARLADMGTASERQEAVQASSIEIARNDFTRRDAVLLELERLNSADAVQEAQNDQNTDWAKYMGMTNEQVKAIADKVRADQAQAAKAAMEAKDPFLTQSGETHAGSKQETTTELDSSDGTSIDWEARMREDEANEERERQFAHSRPGIARSI